MRNMNFYAAYSKKAEVVFNSSSGGIFYELCRCIIALKGVVYGAVQEDALHILHKRAATLHEVEKFRQSKYVKSDLGVCYKDVLQDLKENKTVLFSGTGCQIAGLYRYLKSDYTNLYTVEVVCHGVPLTEAYQKYVQEKSIQHKAKLIQINFRDKRYGWKNNTTCEVYENGEEDAILTSVHPQHSSYIKGINVESRCGKCAFAKLPRVADIALADFWKYEGSLVEQNKDAGISLVVTKDLKGNELFENIKNEIYFEEVTKELASESCRHLEHAPFVHVNQKAFCNLIKRISFKTTSDICMKFGDVIATSELCIMQSEDVDYVFQSLLEDNQQIIYLSRDNKKIEGIVTFGAFCRAFFKGEEWINRDFQSVCLDDEDCIKRIDEIFERNIKINRIPIINKDGELLCEVRRTNGSDGRNDSMRYILPFIRAVGEKKKCYFYKRPDLLADFPYSENEKRRIQKRWSFPEMSEDLEKYGEELHSILKNKYSKEYVNNLCKIPPIIKRGKRYQHADGYSELVNVTEGWRKTCFQPEAYKFTIHVYGRCGVFGYAVEDADTLPSRLQNIVREWNIRVVSHSTWGAEDKYIIQNLCEDLREGIIGEHDIILCYMKELPFMDDIGKIGIYFNDTTTAFHQNLKDSDIDFFDIPGHMNAEGYDFIANYILNDLKSDLIVQLTRIEQVKHFEKAQVGSVLDSEQEKEVYEYINKIKTRIPAKYKKRTAGAVLVNCDPFTKGHRYLIETALKEVDFLYVFVVEEDRANFSFKDRINMVRLGVEDLENVIVIPSGQYMASVYTLPDYFFRNTQKHTALDVALDIKIFSKYIAPNLSITKRFLGTEPNDRMTNEYNKEIKKIMPNYGITVREIERLETKNESISAKTVRRLICEKNEVMLRKFVPESTLNYLKSVGKLEKDYD